MKKGKGNNSQYPDETERLKANPYLVKKIKQSRKDMNEGKGIKMAMEDLWK